MEADEDGGRCMILISGGSTDEFSFGLFLDGLLMMLASWCVRLL